jgi:hypothetical protein
VLTKATTSVLTTSKIFLPKAPAALRAFPEALGWPEVGLTERGELEPFGRPDGPTDIFFARIGPG